MQTELILDRAGRRIIASTTQDVEPILERNKALRGERQCHDCARLIADIPAVIIVQWLNEECARGNIHLRPFTREFNETVVARKLRDPEWKHLRIG
jgi:hypothetical protein